MTEQPSGSVSVTALRQVRILSSLNDEQLAHLADQCTWSRCDGATEVLIQNTPCDQVYFVCNGRVSAKTFSGAGKEITFAELTSGDVFGELSALDGQPRSSFVVTVEESLLASLSAQAFNAFLDKHPQMMRSLMIELALRLRQADEKVFEFSTLSSGNRIHTFADIIHDAGYASPIRRPRGEDIMAACGQLKSATERARKSRKQIEAETGSAR